MKTKNYVEAPVSGLVIGNLLRSIAAGNMSKAARILAGHIVMTPVSEKESRAQRRIFVDPRLVPHHEDLWSLIENGFKKPAARKFAYLRLFQFGWKLPPMAQPPAVFDEKKLDEFFAPPEEEIEDADVVSEVPEPPPAPKELDTAEVARDLLCLTWRKSKIEKERQLERKLLNSPAFRGKRHEIREKLIALVGKDVHKRILIDSRLRHAGWPVPLV